jgi:integrase
MPRRAIPIQQTASGSWQLRYRDQFGQQHKETFSTFRQAETRYAEVTSKVRRGVFIDAAKGRQTFADFAAEWACSRDWKETSRQSWPDVYRRIEPYLAQLCLAEIDRMTLEAMQQQLLQSYARSTVELTMSQAKSVMRAAYVNGRIERDPTVGIKMPKVRTGDRDERVNPEDVPTRAEVLAILDGAPPRFRAALALGVTGLRIGEVMAVSADRIDLEKRLLVIDRQLQRVKRGPGQWENTLTLPKGEKKRTITLPGAVVLELRRHLRDHQGGGLLFRGGRGASLRRYYVYDQAWKPALRAAGLAEDRFVFHSLRHFAASSMLAEGAPITAVAGHLGDTVETVQRVYAHWLRDDRDVPAAVLDRVLAPVSDEPGEAQG